MLERPDGEERRTDNQPEFYPLFEEDNALGTQTLQQVPIDEANRPSNYRAMYKKRYFPLKIQMQVP